ncbi:MAG: hypothetical protein N2259_02380 [Patescibacteria group bacterium]|nr:hypothetical protein [Patescibacteria group bacterium]
MILVINTSIKPYFIASATKRKIKIFYLKDEDLNILVQLEQFLKKNQIKWNQISGLVIVPDYLSFTRQRIIITVANILGIFLNLAVGLVNQNEFQNMEELIKIGQKRLRRGTIPLVYHKEPNITTSR